jgi:hypothetical protein
LRSSMHHHDGQLSMAPLRLLLMYIKIG